jgi:hypothetical protein
LGVGAVFVDCNTVLEILGRILVLRFGDGRGRVPWIWWIHVFVQEVQNWQASY